HVGRLDQVETAQVFLGLGVRPVDHAGAPLAHTHGARGGGPFQLLRVLQLSLRSQGIGLDEAAVHQGIELAFGQRVQQGVVAIDHHEIFHGVRNGEGSTEPWEAGARVDNAAMSTVHDTSSALTCEPIAFVRSPYARRIDAPHQPTVVAGTETQAAAEASIEFVAGFPAAAYRDLDGFERVWLVFAFHRSEGWKAEVRPPRGGGRRSVLATRSPHRPNAIGLSGSNWSRSAMACCGCAASTCSTARRSSTSSRTCRMPTPSPLHVPAGSTRSMPARAGTPRPDRASRAADEVLGITAAAAAAPRAPCTGVDRPRPAPPPVMHPAAP